VTVAEVVVEQLWRGRVLELRLNRPDQLNALSSEVIDALGHAVRIATDNAAVAAVFVTANGRAFSAGADLIEARDRLASPATFREGLDTWRRVFRDLELCPKPVIAIIDGLAIAGGLELALSCDVIVASDRAKFGDGHIAYGLVPGGGGTRRLPDAIGTRAARWLMYTGETVDAHTALALGLVQRVVPVGELHQWTTAFAETLSTRSAPALAFMKAMTVSGQVTDERLEHEVAAAVHVVTGPDAQEGLAAFEQKRAPAFPSVTSQQRS
jgi:enoyl-CoA hydratase/carnithine racemase